MNFREQMRSSNNRVRRPDRFRMFTYLLGCPVVCYPCVVFYATVLLPSASSIWFAISWALISGSSAFNFRHLRAILFSSENSVSSVSLVYKNFPLALSPKKLPLKNWNASLKSLSLRCFRSSLSRSRMFWYESRLPRPSLNLSQKALSEPSRSLSSTINYKDCE